MADRDSSDADEKGASTSSSRSNGSNSNGFSLPRGTWDGPGCETGTGTFAASAGAPACTTRADMAGVGRLAC